MFRIPFATLALTATLPAATEIFQKFEGDGYDTWKVEGTAFGLAPAAGLTDGMTSPFVEYADESLASSSHGGASSKGTLTSPVFTIREPYITFLIAGGNQAGKTAVQLVVDGKVVLEANGQNSLQLKSVLWDVSKLTGQSANLRLIDDADSEWGFIAADHLIFTDYPNQKFPGPTRGGIPFMEGLVLTDVIANVNIPTDATLKVEATHKDHQVTSPTALTLDDQGRVYLAETHRFREGVEDDRDHLYWYLDDLASMKTSDRRALHEKWKEKVPLESLTKKSEIIRRLADTDGDGKLDESKVFADGFDHLLDGTAAGVFFHEGSLYVACIPKIYQLRDTDGDGAADDRKTIAEGFGVRISLSGHDLNGFTLGPDGRIYGTVGDRGLNLVTPEGVPYVYPNEGAAFRFEPDGTDFEIFHTGLRNPKEIAFDALGNAFTVDNNSDQGDAARIVYLVEGGDSGWQMEHQAMHSFHRQIGLTERPPNRWMDEKMWELENPTQPAYMLPPNAHLTSGPSGLTYHPGAGFLECEAGRFLIADYRGGAVNSGIWSFEMKPKGAGMELTDARKFAWGIAATDVEYSWDGQLFITDFITGWKTHQDGRLLSLSAGEKIWQAAEVKNAAAIMKEGLEQRSSAELLNLLKHPDFRIRLRAQVVLTRKPDALERFSAALLSTSHQVRIHGIWGLGILARRGSVPLPFAEFGAIPTEGNRTGAEVKLISLLADKDPEIRAQALRVLGDSKTGSQNIQLTALLTDPSPRVRFFAALLVGKRQLVGYYDPICEMLAENDNRDVYLRHAGIIALQGMAKKPAILTSLVDHPSAAVRLAATVALRRTKDPNLSNFINDPDPKVADEAIRAICDLDLITRRASVATLLDNLSSRSWKSFMLRRLIHNAYRVGTEENAIRLLKVAADTSVPESVRQEALRLLSSWAEPFPVDQFTGHWRPLEKRDLATLKPALLAGLPTLVQQGGSSLTGALQLVKQYQLDLPTLDDIALRQLVKDASLPAAARSLALEIFIQGTSADLGNFLTELASDPSDEVVLTALAAMAKLSPSAALPALKSAIASTSISRRQKAWTILATVPGSEADTIFITNLEALRATNGVSPFALELIAAAKNRGSESVKSALATYENSTKENSDPLAKWNASLEGGDPISGAALFASHPASECMRCHRAEDGHAAGGETAPNLAGIATRHSDRRFFLKSMVQPSAEIAPGFGAVLVDFKNGASLTGNLIAEQPDHLDLEAAGKFHRILRSDIRSVTAPTSPMPPMGDLLKPGEMRDIIAWLATLDQGEAPAPTSTFVPLDPATLLVATKSAMPTPAGIDPEIMKLGKQQYMTCGACHGQNGEGTGSGPPIAGSEWVTGPAENLIRIQLRGLQGPIMVKGREYNFPAGMIALAYQTDEQIAAVLTYIRNSFGNTAPAVTSTEVAALRPEVGKPAVTVADLIAPTVTTGPTPNPKNPATPAGNKYQEIGTKTSSLKWMGYAIALLAFGFVAFNMKKKK